MLNKRCAKMCDTEIVKAHERSREHLVFLLEQYREKQEVISFKPIFTNILKRFIVLTNPISVLQSMLYFPYKASQKLLVIQLLYCVNWVAEQW